MRFRVTVDVEAANFAAAFAAAKKTVNEGDALDLLASGAVEVKPDRRHGEKVTPGQPAAAAGKHPSFGMGRPAK